MLPPPYPHDDPFTNKVTVDNAYLDYTELVDAIALFTNPNSLDRSQPLTYTQNM